MLSWIRRGWRRAGSLSSWLEGRAAKPECRFDSMRLLPTGFFFLVVRTYFTHDLCESLVQRLLLLLDCNISASQSSNLLALSLLSPVFRPFFFFA